MEDVLSQPVAKSGGVNFYSLARLEMGGGILGIVLCSNRRRLSSF